MSARGGNDRNTAKTVSAIQLGQNKSDASEFLTKYDFDLVPFRCWVEAHSPDYGPVWVI